MAAVTPSLVRNGLLGDYRMVLARFADTTDDGDTWASGLKGIVTYWTADRDNPTTQGSEGVAVTLSGSTFTLHPAEDNKNFDLIILCKS
jgi:hypothetical protein